jgi:hypothetical protein
MKKKFKNISSSKYLQYHGRWQLSTLVMTPFMYFFTESMGLPSVYALPIVQFIGACIFWYVDRWIFEEN